MYIIIVLSLLIDDSFIYYLFTLLKASTTTAGTFVFSSSSSSSSSSNNNIFQHLVFISILANKNRYLFIYFTAVSNHNCLDLTTFCVSTAVSRTACLIMKISIKNDVCM